MEWIYSLLLWEDVEVYPKPKRWGDGGWRCRLRSWLTPDCNSRLCVCVFMRACVRHLDTMDETDRASSPRLHHHILSRMVNISQAVSWKATGFWMQRICREQHAWGSFKSSISKGCAQVFQKTIGFWHVASWFGYQTVWLVAWSCGSLFNHLRQSDRFSLL